MDKRVKRETFHIHQIDEGVEEQKNVDELKTDMPFPPKASRNTFRLRNHLTQILTVQRSAIKVRNQHLGRGAQADVYLGEFADFVVAVKVSFTNSTLSSSQLLTRLISHPLLKMIHQKQPLKKK
jgi:hypothetical protein